MYQRPKFAKTYDEALEIANYFCIYDLKGPVIRTPGKYFWDNYLVPIEVEAYDGIRYDIFKERETKK